MRGYILLFFSFCIFSSESLIAQSEFDKHFSAGAIRYDFLLVGDRSSTEVIHTQSKELPFWGGNPENLLNKLDRGNYCMRLRKPENGNILFEYGFNPLYDEWLTVPESSVESKAYYYAVHFPKPKQKVVLEIQERVEAMQWKTVFTDTVSPDDYFILKENSPEVDVDTIMYAGICSQNIDVLLLTEGYTANEMEKYGKDARRLVSYLFEFEPFNEYKDRFNVFALKTPSLESGVDVPGKGIYRNTAFNAHYYTFDSPRYLTTSDMKSIYDAVDFMGFDQLYLLVNEETYGGGGFYNMLSVSSVDNERSPFVFCHEFAHAFAGLADEYYLSETSYEEFYNLHDEPWEPNLTTLIDFDQKWSEMINDTIPIPTPRDSIFDGRVGVFEGGGYQARGIYSPVMSCWMKEEKAGGFCPVCQQAIREVILLNSK